MRNPIPLSLYIHLPWCIRKCPYCDFNSHELRDELPQKHYAQTLIKDFDERAASLSNRPLDSIFFGGGTPSLFDPWAIQFILDELKKRIHFSEEIEITLEANPGAVDETKFAGFLAAGVNRLSLGVQSLQDEKLKTLGRIHQRDHALTAIATLKKIGFNNFNVDLMHGLPEQTVEEALQDLKTALTFSPPHLSWYQLTMEPNTYFHRYPPTLPDDEVLFEIQEAGHALLMQHGFNNYEVSAYAQSGRGCKHNLNYWEFGDYLGIGAGAHSKITQANGSITRHWQMKNPRDYLDETKAFTAEEKVLTASVLPFEFMLNALRLLDGFTLEMFYQRTFLGYESISKQVEVGVQKGLLQMSEDRIQCSALGKRFLNEVCLLFL